MKYILDANSISVLSNFYPDILPTFWGQLDQLVEDNKIFSSTEVYLELQDPGTPEFSRTWAENNKEIFLPVTDEIGSYVAQIFMVRHFMQNIKAKEISKGKQVADPFVIATAMSIDGCVVTEESNPKNGARIPNICDRFNVDCMNLETMLKTEGVQV